jgi:hypothetical protein
MINLHKLADNVTGSDLNRAVFQDGLQAMLHWEDPRFNENSIEKQYGHSIRTQYSIERSLSFHLVASRY